MKQIRIRINDLIDQHKDDFYTCKGCPICTRIKLLSKELQRDSAEKFQDILNKGSDMTKSDIALLLENDVKVRKIRDHAGIPHQDFYQMLKNYGFSKDCPQKGRKKQVAQLMMTVDEFINLKHDQKLTVSKIAGLKGVSEATVYNWQKNRQGQINMALGNLIIPPPETAVMPDTAKVKLSKCNCSKNDKSAEYEQLIKALRDDLKEAHNQCDEKDEKIRQLENVNAACEDVENETASLREEKNQLQWEFDKLKSKEYHTSYAVENQMKRIKDLGKTLERYEEENKALRSLLRLWM